MRNRILRKLTPLYCNLHKKSFLGKVASNILMMICHLISACDISPHIIYPESTYIPHFVGIVIGQTTILGENVTIMPNVVLGKKSVVPPPAEEWLVKRHPTIGRNVFLGAGAVILGDIVVGDNSVIAANSTLTISVPEGSLVTGFNQVREHKRRRI